MVPTPYPFLTSVGLILSTPSKNDAAVLLIFEGGNSIMAISGHALTRRDGTSKLAVPRIYGFAGEAGKLLVGKEVV